MSEPQAATEDDRDKLWKAIETNLKLLSWFNPTCDLGKLWLPLIAGPLQPGRESRGHQRDTWNIASICTGVSPEDRVGGLFQTNHRLVFTNDPKGWAIKWIETNNFKQPDVHFVDLKDVAAGKPAFTATGDQIRLQEFIRGLMIHVLLAGISCRPSSFARTKRAQDIWSHPDTWMLAAFLDSLLLTDAEAGVVENVDGFLKTDQKTGISPVFRLAQLAEEKGILTRWAMLVVVLDGKTFLVWDRHRVWILFLKISSGPEFKNSVIRMIQDFPHNAVFYLKLPSSCKLSKNRTLSRGYRCTPPSASSHSIR